MLSRSQGCNGGFVDHAWQFMQAHGLVTEGCDPYTDGSVGADGDVCQALRQADPVQALPDRQADAGPRTGGSRWPPPAGRGPFPPRQARSPEQPRNGGTALSLL